MRTIFFSIGLAVFVVGLLSCGASKPSGAANTLHSGEAMSVDSAAIVEKYWKLVEIGGKKVLPSDDWVREPHLLLKMDESRVTGNTGCNSLFGTYALRDGNRISFSQMGATKMACPNLELERQLFEVLEFTDNYTVQNDTLFLNKARTAPLARFEAVYLR